MRPCHNHLRAISQCTLEPSISKISLNITYLIFPSDFRGAIELMPVCFERIWITTNGSCLNRRCHLARTKLTEFQCIIASVQETNTVPETLQQCRTIFASTRLCIVHLLWKWNIAKEYIYICIDIVYIYMICIIELTLFIFQACHSIWLYM